MSSLGNNSSAAQCIPATPRHVHCDENSFVPELNADVERLSENRVMWAPLPVVNVRFLIAQYLGTNEIGSLPANSEKYDPIAKGGWELNPSILTTRRTDKGYEIGEKMLTGDKRYKPIVIWPEKPLAIAELYAHARQLLILGSDGFIWRYDCHFDVLEKCQLLLLEPVFCKPEEIRELQDHISQPTVQLMSTNRTKEFSNSSNNSSKKDAHHLKAHRYTRDRLRVWSIRHIQGNLANTWSIEWHDKPTCLRLPTIDGMDHSGSDEIVIDKGEEKKGTEQKETPVKKIIEQISIDGLWHLCESDRDYPASAVLKALEDFFGGSAASKTTDPTQQDADDQDEFWV